MFSKRPDESGRNVNGPSGPDRNLRRENPAKFAQKVVDSMKPILRPIYRPATHALVSLICTLRKDYQGLIYVDPSEIKTTINQDDPTLKQNGMWHFGTVNDGDWDLHGIPIKECGHIYSILAQRVMQRKDYNEITEFRKNLRLMKQGQTPDNCANEKDYREKWHRIESVYELLRTDGYKTQRELGTAHPLNEIRVQVGRDGNLLFKEGIHRLIISQLLDFKKIPVIVTRRHANWVRRNRQKIYNYDCRETSVPQNKEA